MSLVQGYILQQIIHNNQNSGLCSEYEDRLENTNSFNQNKGNKREIIG